MEEEEQYQPKTILDKVLEKTRIVKCKAHLCIVGTRSVHYVGIVFVVILSIYTALATLLCLFNLLPAVYLEFQIWISLPTILLGLYTLYGFIYNFARCIFEHPGPVYFSKEERAKDLKKLLDYMKIEICAKGETPLSVEFRSLLKHSTKSA